MRPYWYGFWQDWELRAKVTFDGATRTITVNPGVTSVDIRTDVYSRWMDWLGIDDNVKYTRAMRYSGLDPIPNGFTGDAYFLSNGWKFIADVSKVRITGVLFSDDFETAYYDPSGNAVYPAQVASIVNTVTLTQNVVTGDLASLPTAEQNAAAVWNHQTTDQTSTGTFGTFVKKLLTVSKFLGLK